MAVNVTYDSLVSDIPKWVERTSDAEFTDQVPSFINLAENRIATEVRGLGFIRVVTGNLTLHSSVVSKPARWRETISWNFGTGVDSNDRNTLYLRTYEFCRTFWPNTSVYGVPRYYSDYDYEHFLVVGTPDAAYPFELRYHERPEPLDETNQENWTTQYAPQLLLYATLLETQAWLRNDERIAVWQQMYDRAVASLQREDNRRVDDQSTTRGKA